MALVTPPSCYQYVPARVQEMRIFHLKRCIDTNTHHPRALQELRSLQRRSPGARHPVSNAAVMSNSNNKSPRITAVGAAQGPWPVTRPVYFTKAGRTINFQDLIH